MKAFVRDCRLWAGAIALLCALLVSGVAGAQGFMVKPMRFEVSVPAGRSVEVPLEVRNTAGSEIREIDLRLAPLSQNPNGTWRLVEGDVPETADGQFSSLDWTSLSATSAAIEPLQPAEIMVRFDAPPDARGAYFAAIIAETPVPQDATGLVVRVRFVIPVIVQIEGRPARQQVALKDAVMAFHDGSDGGERTTTAGLVITNDGRTYSRVDGRMTIERQSGERWRPVTRFDIDEKPIIPGMTLELGRDLGRRLPSGTYRLLGDILVDGRRVPPVNKVIEFQGDPTIDELAYDTALILEPRAVEMEVVPGATRTTILSIENPGEDPVQVEMQAKTPRGLIGVATDKLVGIELSAEPWTEIRPNSFTIRPGVRQNVRVISRVPAENATHPRYYADLVLDGTYADGQSAGETQSRVLLSNQQAELAPAGMIEQLALSEGEKPSQHFVQVRMANIGNVDVVPDARVFVLNAQGRQVRNVALSGEEGPLLPLNKRSFSAELDFGGLEPGYYALRAVVDGIGEADVVRQEVVQVEETPGTDGEDARTVTVVDPAAGAELLKDEDM